jgi:phage I-like protein
MTAKEYLGDIIGGSIMLRDNQNIAKVLMNNPTNDQWKQLIEQDNILQKKSIHSAKRMASTIKKRLSGLEPAFLTAVFESDEKTSIQLILVAILIHSPILADFMRTVLVDAYRFYQERLKPDDWETFYQERARSILELSAYSDSSIKKMGNNVIKILVDSGYLKSTRTKELQTQYLLPDTREWLLKLNREDLISIMEPGIS